MIYYLIVDKTNKVLTDFTDKNKADAYVKSRPYLKVKEFDNTPVSDPRDNPLTDDDTWMEDVDMGCR